MKVSIAIPGAVRAHQNKQLTVAMKNYLKVNFTFTVFLIDHSASHNCYNINMYIVGVYIYTIQYYVVCFVLTDNAPNTSEL